MTTNTLRLQWLKETFAIRRNFTASIILLHFREQSPQKCPAYEDSPAQGGHWQVTRGIQEKTKQTGQHVLTSLGGVLASFHLWSRRKAGWELHVTSGLSSPCFKHKLQQAVSKPGANPPSATESSTGHKQFRHSYLWLQSNTYLKFNCDLLAMLCEVFRIGHFSLPFNIMPTRLSLELLQIISHKKLVLFTWHFVFYSSAIPIFSQWKPTNLLLHLVCFY